MREKRERIVSGESEAVASEKGMLLIKREFHGDFVHQLGLTDLSKSGPTGPKMATVYGPAF